MSISASILAWIAILAGVVALLALGVVCFYFTRYFLREQREHRIRHRDRCDGAANSGSRKVQECGK